MKMHSTTLEDAIAVSRFSASYGVASPDLSEAIVEASSAPQGAEVPGHREKIEQNLLQAIATTLKAAGVSSVNDVRRYGTRRHELAYQAARYFALTVMLLSIVAIIPLTFLFEQVTRRVFEINELDLAIQRNGIEGAARLLRLGAPSREQQTSIRRLQATGAGSAPADQMPEQLTDVERSYDIAQIKVRVEQLLRPPRLMDFTAIVSNYLFRWVFGRDAWTAVTWHYHPSIDPDRPPWTNVDIKDLNSISTMLRRSQDDFGFVGYLLGRGILPFLYGIVGASVYILRSYANHTHGAPFLVYPLGEVLMRIGLGAIAGIAMGWFHIPQAAEQITTTPMALAFLGGFSIDVVFSLFERVIAAFDFRREAVRSS